MSDDEVYQYALKQKNEGNVNFKAKNMRQAEFYYRDAINYLYSRKKIVNEEWDKLRIACYQNMAVALNSLGDHSEAILACTVAIEIDSKAVKAYY